MALSYRTFSSKCGCSDEKQRRHPEMLDNGGLFPDHGYKHTFITTMARPQKQRFVSPPPRASMFKPRGIPMPDLELVVLSLDELEAIRLADLDGNQHEHAATKMNVSRQTFGRILERAHRTVADALIHGKALQIEGGSVATAKRGKVRCHRCHRAWEVPLPASADFQCPRCPQKD